MNAEEKLIRENLSLRAKLKIATNGLEKISKNDCYECSNLERLEYLKHAAYCDQSLADHVLKALERK